MDDIVEQFVDMSCKLGVIMTTIIVGYALIVVILIIINKLMK